MKKVQLKYGRSSPSGKLIVAVVDVETGDLVLEDGIKCVARWLQVCGYRWVFGSNALWEA